MSVLRRRRVESGLNLEQVAKRCGVSIATVAGWETRTRNPTAKRVPKYARVLGFTPQELTRILWPEEKPALVPVAS